jgi:hypothetical protein
MFIRKPRSEKTTLSILNMCNEENIILQLKIIDNFFLRSDLVVKVREENGNYFFYVFDRKKGCICYCEFINHNAVKHILKLKKYKNIFTPHCDTHPKYRRLGLASAVYRYFILNAPEVTLITDKHTKSAKNIWEYVCKEINGKIVYHNLVTGKEQTGPTKSNIKLLIKNAKELSDSKMQHSDHRGNTGSSWRNKITPRYLF